MTAARLWLSVAVIVVIGGAVWLRSGAAGPEQPSERVKVVQVDAPPSTAPAVDPAATPRSDRVVPMPPPDGETPSDMPPPVETPADSDPTVLARAVRAEPRDPAWAPRTEAALRDRIARLPYLGGSETALRVQCRATLCEAQGYFPRSASMENMNAAMTGLQGDPMDAALDNLSLVTSAQMFDSHDGRGRFTLWVRRKPG